MKNSQRPDWTTWGVLAAAVCAIAWRAPIVWWEPRFWGEEGALYFAYARQQGVLASLFFVPTSGFPAGYLLLAASLPATLASFVSLEVAPRVTTFCAFLVQLAPLAVVLFGNSPLWRGRVRRALVCCVLVFAPAVIGEVWLNTINSQVFCGLVAALILVSEGPENRLRPFFRALLVFCGLSGPYTSFLAPIFWLKTRVDQSVESLIHWRIVLATATLQASIFVWTTFTYPLAPERFDAGRWALRSAAAAYHFVIRSLFGENLGLKLADLLGLRQPLGSIAEAYWLPTTAMSTTGLSPTLAPVQTESLAGWIGLGVFVAILCWLGRRAHPWAHLLTAAVVISGTLITLSIGHLFAAGRYAVVPGTLLLVRVAVASWDDGPSWRQWSARLVLAVGLLVGVLGFRNESPPGAFGLAPGRPSWTEEVAAWRSDSNYEMRIWAYNLDVPNRLALTAAPATDSDLRALEAPGFQLISTGEWATWRLPSGEVPKDFRIVFDFETSRPAGELEIEIRLLSRWQHTLGSWPIKSCAALKSCRVTLERQDLRTLSRWRDKPIHGLEIAMRSKRAQPARLVATRLRVASRLEGALEPLLARRRSSTSSRSRETLAGEATALAMVESWRLDGDFAFGADDLERVRQRWEPGTRVELRRQGDHLAYRGSHLQALVAGAMPGSRASVFSGIHLAAFLILVVLAIRRGVTPLLAISTLLASWAGVELFSPSGTWILALTLWTGLAAGRGMGTRYPWLTVIWIGVMAALMSLDSPAFLPLALVPIVEHFRQRRNPRMTAAALLISLLSLAAMGLQLNAEGGLSWWSTGEDVVLAREAFEPTEHRPLVIPQDRSEQRGISGTTEPLWAVPDLVLGPLFAYPLLIVWAFVWIRSWRRSPRLDVDYWLLPIALAMATSLAWFLSPSTRVGPHAWSALYPLLLWLPLDWPKNARRAAHLVAVLWIVAVLRSFY